jgi:hypothetical protein
MSIRTIWSQANLAMLGAHMRLQRVCERYVDSPRDRRLMLGSAAVVCCGLLVSTSASAQATDGVAGMINTAGVQADSIKLSLGKVFAAFGFGGAGYGGYNWWRKGKEGEQSHIKGGQIFGPILAGAALGAIGFVMIKAGESVGIQRTDLGNVPT